MKLLPIVCVVALSLGTASGAKATQLIGSFSGVVTNSNYGNFTNGEAINGTFSFDTADQSIYDNQGTYVNFEAYVGSLPYQLSISVGGTTFSVSNVVTEYTQVANQDSYYGYGYWTSVALTHDYTLYTLMMMDYLQNVSYLANIADLSTTNFAVNTESIETSSIIAQNGNELDFGITSMSVDAAAVPEPGSLALIAVGLAGLGLLRRRRNA